MGKGIHVLTPEEIEIFNAGVEDPNITLGYLFHKPGMDRPFQLDYNFTEEGKWQKSMCMAKQTFVVAVCGIGCSDIDSHIYDADLKRYVTIRWLLQNKRKPIVLSRTNNGWRKVRASEPYLKGSANMVRISLSDGNIVDVSLDHRFLTPSRGYVHTHDLRVGDSLVAPRNLPSNRPFDSHQEIPNLESDNKFDTPTITGIRYIGIRDVYDIHVPIWNNYVMDGVVNHNSGKSLGVGMSAFYHCVQTDGFKFLNVAAELWQATQMHELIMQFAEGCVAEDFISSAPMGAHPKIVIEYLVPPSMRRIKSTMEILSFGEKGDAKNILSWRGDWVNLEEAFRIEGLTDKVATLSTRLTGSTSSGRPYIGRMSLITNPLPNPEGWMLYDQAAADTENGLAIEIETKANKNVTDEQVKRMLALIPEKDRASFTTGKRPEGAGKYFTRDIVEQCEDKITSELILTALKNNEKGFIGKHRPRLGYYHLEIPPKDERIYYMFGDPGIDNAPKRNSPVWMVFDVTDAPRLAALQALWWGDGNGKIEPFVLQMIEWIVKYKPILCGVDNTGTQKNTAEIITKEYLQGKDDMSVQKLTGFDFSGSKKMTYLLCAKLAIENATITWPSICQGIGDQLQNYDPSIDKSQASKVPNDLVSALSMAAFKIRSSFGASTEGGEQNQPQSIEQSLILRRSNREYPSAFRDSRRYPQIAKRKKIFGSGDTQ